MQTSKPKRKSIKVHLDTFEAFSAVGRKGETKDDTLKRILSHYPADWREGNNDPEL